MADAGSDWTNSWRALARVSLAAQPASGDGAAEEGPADDEQVRGS